MKLPLEKLLAGAIAVGVAGLMMATVFALQVPFGSANAQTMAIPPPAPEAGMQARVGIPAHSETIVFAGGCFWGVQGVFEHVNGVQRAVSGYIGGSAATARYYVVATGATGHAEAVQVTYDPAQVSYATLMQVFFSVVHDPTQLNRQGPDHGTQYRSAIFTTTPEQAQATRAYIAQLGRAGVFHAPIVTQVESGKRFYPAEAYHQDYLTLHPDEAYIRFNDLPKIGELKRLYPTLYRPRAVLVAAH
ncbi:peptide-methionine (S)-S-oxide reductase [Lysobacter niabensis]|uniref:Peptide methionine sulfoxide reductase MsrA n=1 Tax=Agrilutibacter niabensis TaxID=380628 RepID=A0ABU1VTW1_9GAMM|nr:peptide-methionine (S)-S-oxide reductase MsrA [Lysobacter niabensis]MDR7100658.1 peptide-methionine (S)-S-oxide reductase [Lysobacter niabensis]